MFFSQRKGFVSVSTEIQKDFMTIDLRNKLWNIFDGYILRLFNISEKDYHKSIQSGFDRYLIVLFHEFFKTPIYTRPESNGQTFEFLVEYFFKIEWNEVYDFLEFTLTYYQNDDFSKKINQVLERELSGYRFINNICTSITDKEEIQMLEETLSNNDFPGVTIHLKRALELLSDKKNPDFRNSIKESISAVESLAKIITNNPKASLGDALNELEKNKKIHKALAKGFSSIYGYTSDEGGIRHGMIDESDFCPDDAKFFLFSCTSFINYLKTKM